MVTAAQAYWLNRKRRRARNEGVSLSSLFAAGEDGFLFGSFPATTLFQDTAAATPVAANDDPVGRANDQSGRGRNATQGTALNRPLWKSNSGKPYLNFDGINDALGTTFAPTAAITLACAFNNSGADVHLIGGGNGGEGKRAFLGVDASGRLMGGWGAQLPTTIFGGSDIRNSNRVGLITLDTVSVDLWLDGVRVYTGAPSGSGVGASSGEFYLGAALLGAGNWMAGRMSAALALNRRVTTAEIAMINTAFQATF